MLNQTQSVNSGQELQTDDRPIRMIGFVILFVTFGVFGVWSFVAPIDGSALAPGVVAVKSHRKTIQHLDGGIVKKIVVKDGDSVSAGDVLLVLDDTQTRAQLEIVRGQYISVLAQHGRLVAERDQLDEVAFSEKLLNDQDYRTQEAKQTQLSIFNARKNSYQGEISVLKQRVSQLKSKINGLGQQRGSNQQLLNSYSEEMVDLKELLAEGFADRQRLRDLERNHARVQGEVAQLTADIASSEIQIGETKLQILQLQKEFQETVVNELGEVNAQLFDLEERMNALQDKVVRTEITAPAAGMVMGLQVHTEGGVIKPSEPIMEIVPQKEELIVNAQVSPLDIDRVHVGLLANVRFSAFKSGTTPVAEGKLVTLSADRLIDQNTGQPYFSAEVEITPESMAELAHVELLPGMPAEVLISTGERTLFEYLTQPISNAFARAFIED
jgi:epimerase transport system membrane fusion protein